MSEEERGEKEKGKRRWERNRSSISRGTILTEEFGIKNETCFYANRVTFNVPGFFERSALFSRPQILQVEIVPPLLLSSFLASCMFFSPREILISNPRLIAHTRASLFRDTPSGALKGGVCGCARLAHMANGYAPIYSAGAPFPG